MKIQGPNPLARFVNEVRDRPERKDADGSGGGGSEQREPDKNSGESSNSEDLPPSSEKLQAAVQDFQGDAHTQAHGISASVEGQGPGLRVVLKDVSGGVLQRYSGEEFVKLRDSAREDIKPRGKILDRKL